MNFRPGSLKNWALMVPIKKIEAFFNDNDPGKDPVKLYPGTTVNDPRAFVKYHLEILKAAADKSPEEKRILKPFYNRLLTLYTLKNGNNRKN